MFRDTLEGLRNNNVPQDHWRLLSTRVRGNLSAAEVAMFNNALRIYGKKKDVNTYNHRKMRDLVVSVKEIKAQHTGTGAVTAEWERGGNLHKSLPLCLGARVMLTENSWTERGLVNGALGTVKGFHWQEGTDIERSIPTILVAFDNYDRPLLEDFEGGICAVTIAPSKREFTINNIACTRIQVPLTVAQAITIHKAQGITTDKIVTNIVEKDHIIGLTYVAVS